MSKSTDWKRKYQLQLARGEDKDQIERQRARRMYDKLGIERKGKDIDHINPMAKGGKSTPSNLRLRASSANQADNKRKK